MRDTPYPGDKSGGCFGIYFFITRAVYSAGVVYNGGCGKHRRVRYVRFAGVVPLLLLLLYRCCTAQAFAFQRKRGLESSRLLCSSWHAHITHTRISSQQSQKELEVRLLLYHAWLPQPRKLSFLCYTVTPQQTAQKTKGESLILHLSFSDYILPVPTYCCCCCRIRVGCPPASCGLWVLHTDTKHRSRHKGNSSNSGCCVLYSCCRTAVLLGTTAVAPWLLRKIRGRRGFVCTCKPGGIFEINKCAARVGL